MYKNPQLSDQAKRLREELAKLGMTVSHSQALEVTARLDGARTLHVAQAKNNAGIRIGEVARMQAEALMFPRLGRFEGNFEGLLQELRAIGIYEEAGDDRATDNAFRTIFREANGPELGTGYEDCRAEDLPAAFDALVQKLTDVMTKAAKAPPQAPLELLLFKGPAFDWRVQEGTTLAELPESHRQRYEVEMKRSSSQFYLDMAPPHDAPDEICGKPQMSVFFEVNNGLPCLHVSNDRYGDQVLTIFATQDGLYLRPDGADLSIRTGVPDEQQQPGLFSVHKAENDNPFLHRQGNHAFIPARNG